MTKRPYRRLRLSDADLAAIQDRTARGATTLAQEANCLQLHAPALHRKLVAAGLRIAKPDVEPEEVRRLREQDLRRRMRLAAMQGYDPGMVR